MVPPVVGQRGRGGRVVAVGPGCAAGAGAGERVTRPAQPAPGDRKAPMKHFRPTLAAMSIVSGVCVSLLLAPRATSAAGDAPAGKGPATRPVRVVVWDEQQPQQKPAYDNFLGNAIADYLKSRPGFTVRSVN